GGYCNLSKGMYTLDQSILSHQLYDYFQHDFGIPKHKNGIKVSFILSSEITNEEGYDLHIDADHIQITASNRKGHFYAIQTLRQLISGKKLPRAHIIDTPRFAWRAFMLDEARHFQGKETVKKMLDE